MRAAEQIQLSSLRHLLYLVGYGRRKLIAYRVRAATLVGEISVSTSMRRLFAFPVRR
jgi:hypothetical protein